MALVNYDYSDDEELSENEEEQVEINKKEIEKKPEKEEQQKVMLNLPPPKSQSSLTDIVLAKKPGGTVKIAAPSLRKFLDDDEEDEEMEKPKRFKPSSCGTALSLLLPKPKFGASSSEPSKLLIPQSVVRPKPSLPAPKKIAEKQKPVKTVKAVDEHDDQEEHSGDFFSLNDSYKIGNVKIVEPQLEVKVDNQQSENTNRNLVDIAPHFPEYEEQSAPYYGPSIEPTCSNPSSGPSLEDYTYKKMIASKFGEETADEINIVDIDVSKHLSQSKDWLKTISEEKEEPYQGVMPTSTARRKHQITYLAFQAKQREVELKNQWAANRMTKSQTRSKYGF